MSFPAGSIGFHRFNVLGTSPLSESAVLEMIQANAYTANEFGIFEEDTYGWGGARHLYDADLSLESCVFSGCIHFALRLETNKVPGAVRAAYQSEEETAIAKANPSGFISKAQRKIAKETVCSKCEQEARDGKHRKTRIVPVLWDLEKGIVYAKVTGAALEKLFEIFERSFQCEIIRVTSGLSALASAESQGNRRKYEDLRPTRFVVGAEGDNAHPDYPWIAKGPEPKDFLGNEFLVWLWHEADGRTSVIKPPSSGEVTVMLDRGLDLECAYGQTGKNAIRGVGPSQTPEARDALRVGKVPRKAGLIIDHAKQQFSFTIHGESLGVAGAQLPSVEEAETPRQLFEYRISLLRDLCAGIDAMFAAFLAVRLSPAWDAQVATIRRWIEKTAAKAVAA